jgi:hypothetical protein
MNLLKRLRAKLESFRVPQDQLLRLEAELFKVREALGRIETRQTEMIQTSDLASHEFRVFSQTVEDGIIQYLLRHVPISRKAFVEIGVENYTECNTRFLLVKDNWQGLAIDGNAAGVEAVRRSPLYWQYSLRAVDAFVTRENVNQLISDHGFQGDIGLLSIDIDGNDYWVWERLDVVKPAIVVIEYNHRFGKERAVTIPYAADFFRGRALPSMIYFGASLKALCLLGEKKGYAFVGCTSTGINAFFVRKDLKPASLRALSAEEGFVAGKFRESRDREGRLLFLSPEEEARILAPLPLVDVESGGQVNP